MARYGRVIRLREGAVEEYEEAHRGVWPEVADAARRAGIRNYTIFRYDRWLFSYFELPDETSLDEVGDIFAASEACCRWEAWMHTLQEPLPESGEESWWVPMREIWHAGNPSEETA